MKTTIKFLLMATTLLCAGMFASCSDDDAKAVVKTELQAAVDVANDLLATTSEGVAAGNYLRGSQAPLRTAVDAAQAVLDDPKVKQAAVTNATVQLGAALEVYASKQVVPIDPTNLVGHWTFDELTTAAVGTSVKDYSGNNRNGTIKAGHSSLGGIVPVLAADRYGVAGKALALDKGANVEIPYNTALNPATITISAWVKLAETRNNRFVGLHSWVGYKFEIQDGNRLFGTIGHSGGSYDRDITQVLNQNEWYHVAVTYVAGAMKFYVNGVEAKAWSDTPNPAVSISGKPYNLVLGQDFPTDKYSMDATGANFDNPSHADYKVIPLAWGGYLHGSLDEVRIYKVALTAAQIAAIYEVEKP